MYLKIKVSSGRYIVVARQGGNEVPLPNWKQHQQAAKTAVQEQAAPPHAGLYDCPGWLASVVQAQR